MAKNIESHQLHFLTIFEAFVNFKYFFSLLSVDITKLQHMTTPGKKNMYEKKANKRKTMTETNYLIGYLVVC